MNKNDKYHAVTDTAEFIKHLQELLERSKAWIVLSEEKLFRDLIGAKEEISNIVEDDDHFWKILEDENLTAGAWDESSEYVDYQKLGMFSKFFTQFPENPYETTEFGKSRVLKEKAIKVLEQLNNYKTINEVVVYCDYIAEDEMLSGIHFSNHLTERLLRRIIPESVFVMNEKTLVINKNVEYINNLLSELSGYKYDNISVGQDMMRRIKELENI